jgi:hypothetical protein
MIPLDPVGYSVNAETGTIHTRYSFHDGKRYIRTRTEKGVRYLLQGKEGKPCKVCYPYPQYATTDTPRLPQRRRTPNAASLPGV